MQTKPIQVSGIVVQMVVGGWEPEESVLQVSMGFEGNWEGGSMETGQLGMSGEADRDDRVEQAGWVGRAGGRGQAGRVDETGRAGGRGQTGRVAGRGQTGRVGEMGRQNTAGRENGRDKRMLGNAPEHGNNTLHCQRGRSPAAATSCSYGCEILLF